MLAFIHPIVWLMQRAVWAQHSGQDPTGWVILATFLLPVWILGSRILAEVPGTQHGRMHLWWLIFAVFHLWGFLFYIFVDRFSESFIFKMRTIRRIEFGDRTPDQIMASPFEVSDSLIGGSSEVTGLPPATVFYASPLSSEGAFGEEDEISPLSSEGTFRDEDEVSQDS